MGKIKQKPAKAGSQKWLQRLINCHPALLDAALRDRASLPSTIGVTWLSPLAHEDHAEYRDQAFLDTLGAVLPNSESLRSFWPTGGPVWDGLGRNSDNRLLLIEAKAHLREMNSPPTKAGEPSLTKIRASLRAAQTCLAPASEVDWSETYYQYTNRLAHLYLLRHVHKLPAYLVNIYFVGDAERRGPDSIDQWKAALKDIKNELGVSETPLDPYIADLFIAVSALTDCPNNATISAVSDPQAAP